VVLKVFSQVPDVSERIVGFDRFLQEYEIVAGLNHENIVRIYDLGIADDHAYIAMEHFPAGDLRQRMKTPMLAPPRRCIFSSRSPARSTPFMPWACCTGT
jgi:serine/threonine protein kinase